MRGDIVVLLFPFSDLSSSKKRPAVVAANISGNDLILVQITSAASRRDKYAINLEAEDFQEGKLHVSSIIRPNKLFTADISIIKSRIGKLKENKLKELQNSLIKIFTK